MLSGPEGVLHSRISEILLFSSATLNGAEGRVAVLKVQVSASVEFGPVIAWGIVSYGMGFVCGSRDLQNASIDMFDSFPSFH